MARVLIKQSPYDVQLPGQEGHLLKIWKDDEEPPKSYIWEHDCQQYVWYCNGWVPVEVFLMNPYYDCECWTPAQQEEDRLKKLLNTFKTDLINQIGRILNQQSENDCTGLTVQEVRDLLYEDE